MTDNAEGNQNLAPEGAERAAMLQRLRGGVEVRPFVYLAGDHHFDDENTVSVRDMSRVELEGQKGAPEARAGKPAAG